MDQEQVIRQVMAEVMKSLGNASVTFEKKSPAAPAPAPRRRRLPRTLPRAAGRSAATSTRSRRSTRSW